MRKLIIGLAAAASFCGCNREVLDTNYVYSRAVMRWPDGSVKELKIYKWRDYDGEQIQIRAEDGKVYLTSSVNAVLVRD